MSETERVYAAKADPQPASAVRDGHALDPVLTYQTDKERSEAMLASLPLSQRRVVQERLRSLSVISSFIGKDFDMPVILAPGRNWYWSMNENYVAVGLQDLLERPAQENRWSIGHEASHRRISRLVEPVQEMRHQPGGNVLFGGLEDPRVNNFLSDNFRLLDEGMHIYYEQQLAQRQEMLEKAQDQLGFMPLHDLASFEHISLWYQDRQRQPMQVAPELPQEIKDYIARVAPYLQDMWWTYPTKDEADRSNTLVDNYAKASGAIITDKIWPEFKKLVDIDMANAAAAKQLQKMIKDLVDGNTPEGFNELPSDMQEMLQQAAEIAKEQGYYQPIKLSDLSAEQLQALQMFIANLPEDVKEQLHQEATEALADLDKQITDQLEAKLSIQMATDGEPGQVEINGDPAHGDSDNEPEEPEKTEQEIQLEQYNELYQELKPLIDSLYNDLNNLFIARSSHGYKSGYRAGRRINIGKRISEKAKGVSAVQSKAWERRELPTQKDYTISLLIDLSGSMRGDRVQEALKSAIVFSEVLSKLNIRFEVYGFNIELYKYKGFNDQFGRASREIMPGMIEESWSPGRAGYNDDGWALTETSERLAQQPGTEKIVVILSDGQPAESHRHNGPEYNLHRVVDTIINNTNQKLASIGIQSESVAEYYPDYSIIQDVTELPIALVEVLRRVIEQA